MSQEGKQVFVAIVHFALLSLVHPQIRHHRRPALERSLNRAEWASGKYVHQTACLFGRRTLDGICQPFCRESCMNGRCVAPQRCSCFAGFKGPRCDEDVNECGLPNRPCSQRCMNTPGSYRCYCDPGYTLRQDGHTCGEETKCFSLRCQFGCRLAGLGATQCFCPPGLHLAEDNRSCKDVDECKQADVCPRRRTCRNTFGSFACVCSDGFVMGTLQGSFHCRDKDECLIGSHGCSRHAQCLNTDGSYVCRCSEGFYGTGRSCRPRTAPQSKAATYFNYKLHKRSKRPQSPPNHRG